MPVKLETHPVNDCIWSQLSVQLVRYYEDVPSSVGRSGTFNARYVSAWYMKRGNVTVRSGNVAAVAKAGQWVIMIPGLRFQRFSEDSELISINLNVSCGLAILSWEGAWVCVLDKYDQLLTAAKLLGEAFSGMPLAKDYGLSIPQVRMEIAQAAYCQAQVLSFFHTLLKKIQESGINLTIQYGQDERVRRSIAYLSNLSLADKFSRQEIARQCGLSASQLDRLWRSELGMTIRHYWDWRRMDYACQCLREKSQSIKEISAGLGFSHATQFSLWFSSSQGIPPRAYRRAIT